MQKILVVDDDRVIADGNKKYLESLGYEAVSAYSGQECLESLSRERFDCILLDILLPDTDGYTLCKKVRALSQAPILFLSCKDEEADKIKGLMSGGDDYITKPFSLKELAARVHAHIRRGTAKSFQIDRDNRLVSLNGSSILLTHKEFDLFLLLYENAGTVVSAERIMQRLRGMPLSPEDNTVQVYIRRLRKKLAPLEGVIGQIDTVHKFGYVFRMERD